MSKPYKKLNLEQGTEIWKQERLKHCTASQTPVLFGLSPYQTKLQLFEEKLTGKEREYSEQTKTLFQIGHKAEKAGRDWIESHLGITIPPTVVISNAIPDLLASLDGFSEAKNVVAEFKYVGKEVRLDVEKGKIPAHHECQVQAQLLATGAERCIYFVLDPEGNAAVTDIRPDKDYINNIGEEVTKFMKDVREGKAPEPSMRDYYFPEDPRFEKLRDLKFQMDQSKEQFESFKDELLKEYEDHHRIKSCGLVIIRALRKGNVNYSKIPQLKGVDLEKYRGTPINMVSISLEKKKERA